MEVEWAEGGAYYCRTLAQELFVEAARSGDVTKLTALIPQLKWTPDRSGRAEIYGRAESHHRAEIYHRAESYHREERRRAESYHRAACYDALQFAAQNGHAEAVKQIILNLVNKERWVHLWCFEEKSHYRASMHQWHFSCAARVTSSPLHLAVREGHLSVVEELVSFFLSSDGADQLAESRRISDCRTIQRHDWAKIGREWFQGLVEWSIRWGHAHILELLLIPQLPFMVALNISGDEASAIRLPLHLAAHHNHLEVLTVLLETAIFSAHPLSNPPLICEDTADGLTALHVAAHSGSSQVVEFLIETAGMDLLNSRSYPELFTALHVASDSGNLEVVKSLLHKRIKPSSDTITGLNLMEVDVLLARDAMGRTALHYAARQGHEDVVQGLLTCSSIEMNNHNNNIASIADHDGLLPLHMAARSGHAGVIEKLIMHSHAHNNIACINQRAHHSLHIKIWVEREYLGAPISDFNVYHGQIYEFPRPKLMDSLFFQTKGFTALHFAARYGHEGALRRLLREGSLDLQANDDGGFSAYDWMEVRQEGKVFLKCVGDRNMKIGSNQVKVAIMASDIADEKESMEGLRHAWGRGCRPPLKAAATVKWLEAEEVGRTSWLQYWIENHSHGHAITSPLTSAGRRDNNIASIVMEMLFHLPTEGNVREEAAFKALKVALKKRSYVVAKEIVLQVPEVAMNVNAGDILMIIKDQDKSRVSEIPAAEAQDIKDFMVALVTREHVWNASNLLRGALGWTARNRSLREMGVMEVILGRGEVKKGLYEDRQVYMECANAILVGAALIGGVAFQGWLQPPLGYSYAYEGEEYAAVHKWAVRWFWRFNNGAFFLAIGALTAGAKGAVPVADVMDLVGSVEKAQRAVAVASTLLGMALVCVMLAFIMAQLAVLPPLASDQHLAVSSVLAGGALVCSLALIWFSFSVWPLLRATLSHLHRL